MFRLQGEPGANQCTRLGLSSQELRQNMKCTNSFDCTLWCVRGVKYFSDKCVRVAYDLRESFFRNKLLLDSNADRLFEQRFEFFSADTLPPVAERSRITREVGLKMCLAVKVLLIRIFEPAGNEGFVGDFISVCQILESDHQSSGRARAPLSWQ